MRGEQIRAARAMLRMEQHQLADQARLSVPTIKRIEAINGPVVGVRRENIEAIKAALQNNGISFINDRGKIGVTLDIALRLEEQVFELLPFLIPGSKRWEPAGPGADRGFDFAGYGPDDNIIFVEVKTRKADILQASRMMEALKRDYGARCIVAIGGGEFDFVMLNGVEVRAFPPVEGEAWQSTEELLGR